MSRRVAQIALSLIAKAERYEAQARKWRDEASRMLGAAAAEAKITAETIAKDNLREYEDLAPAPGNATTKEDE